MNHHARSHGVRVSPIHLYTIGLILTTLISGCMPLSPAFTPIQTESGAVTTPVATEEAASAVPTATAEAAAVDPTPEAADEAATEEQTSAVEETAATEETPATAAPAAEEEPDPVGGLIDVVFKHISFTYDTTVARNWAVEYLSNAPAEGTPPSFEVGPLRMVFRLGDYAAPPGVVEPTIFIYRIADISSQNEYRVANLLGAILAKATPLHNYKTLPFLPLMEEEQTIIGQPQFLQFQSGSGIRYLTINQPATAPFLSSSVWYTFQGLTSDNKHYVAAVFPLAADMFPAEQGEDYSAEAFSARQDEYLLLSKAALNLAPRSAFTPRLSRLDALMESIQILEEQ